MPCPSSVLLLMTATHRTGLPDPGWSLWLLLGQLCHLKPCLPQLAPAMHEMVVVLLSHLWWRSAVFQNNTESQAGQVLVSLPETRVVIMVGHFQMKQHLHNNSGCELKLQISSFSLGAKAHARKLRNCRACVSHI